MKRILDCQSSDFQGISPAELLDAIAASEGRVIACETIGAIQPMLGDITNAEFAAAMGADILLLNMFDVQKPQIRGLPGTEPENVIRKLKELTGRPIGINLEPVEQVLSSQDPDENMWVQDVMQLMHQTLNVELQILMNILKIIMKKTTW